MRLYPNTKAVHGVDWPFAQAIGDLARCERCRSHPSKTEVGSPDGQGNLVLRLAFTATGVRTKGASFQPYRGAWEP